jgi:hypothetical protein
MRGAPDQTFFKSLLCRLHPAANLGPSTREVASPPNFAAAWRGQSRLPEIRLLKGGVL